MGEGWILMEFGKRDNVVPVCKCVFLQPGPTDPV